MLSDRERFKEVFVNLWCTSSLLMVLVERLSPGEGEERVAWMREHREHFKPQAEAVFEQFQSGAEFVFEDAWTEVVSPVEIRSEDSGKDG